MLPLCTIMSGSASKTASRQTGLPAPTTRGPMKNKRLIIIFGVVLVDMLSFSIVLPLLPYLAKSIGATATQIGLLTAVYPLAQVFAAPLLGRLSDAVGRKPVHTGNGAGRMGHAVCATRQPRLC